MLRSAGNRQRSPESPACGPRHMKPDNQIKKEGKDVESGLSKRTTRVIATGDAPAAIGPYAQAKVAGDFLFTAGQIPLDPTTMSLVEGDITAQTEQVMRNLAAVLRAGGSSFEQVLKTTCFLADLNDFPAFNEVYGRFFPNDPPARSTVQVARLPLGSLVEVECVALVTPSTPE